eukprot:CAMPEP_0204828820 /NCGR_PEP_ID=MMETSP1346-20131115/6746_1 /ASSEMBLY_ACC=CAM_ASM_000771 /TAXON_ID=215587 /ORGANISM="Aplanochytrium stocchinoi, Strain GSBS06" /LENGTH=515 /DNA_ID=CAMNT_0051958157 /DNA_START=69 /DNA_END=1613 /DNA_ORIENTATION=-
MVDSDRDGKNETDPDGLPVLIQQMLDPGFYSHQVIEPIKLIQTHISYVILTGEFAYKVKKHVNFGFLDFSTLEKRKHFYREELRLNQRGAREIYLDVLPITIGKDGRYRLGGDGSPVEYTLKMVEFDQSGLFGTLFANKTITEAQMENLGRVLAKYHADEAKTNDYIRSFGRVSQVRKAVDANYQETQSYVHVGGPQTKEQLEQTKQFTDKFFEENTKLFISRMDNGFIRECHGDLHLDNIVLWKKQRPILFDCIEFNEEFRFVDVMYDVAFIVMECDARGRSDMGNAFLNTYIEETGDWEGIQLLHLYSSRHAYVRAKCKCFEIDDPSCRLQHSREKDCSIAARYFKLAWKYTVSKKGRLILMSGISGSGKSTVGKYLARRLDAIQIRSDAVRKHLGHIALSDHSGKDSLYTSEMTKKTYERLLKLGVQLANQGYIVILDAKYDKTKQREGAIFQAANNHLPIQIIKCSAPLEVLRERLKTRSGISDATGDLLLHQKKESEPFTCMERSYVKIW